MIKYFVELDGVSMIQSCFQLEKGDLITLYEDGEIHHYRVRARENQSLSLRLVKTLESSGEGIKYHVDHLELYFENRLSKNQIIVVDDYPYKVIEITKETNILTLEAQERTIAHAVFGAYVSRADEGLNIRDREQSDYKAEMYFQSRGEAIGYVMQERSKGRKISL